MAYISYAYLYDMLYLSPQARTCGDRHDIELMDYCQFSCWVEYRTRLWYRYAVWYLARETDESM